MPTAPVEGGHQECHRSGAKRCCGDQLFELADDDLGVPVRQSGGGELLEPHHPEFLEAERLRTCPWFVGELGQGRSPPPTEALAQHRRSLLVVTVGHRLAGGGQRCLEALGVDGVAVGDQDVARGSADDPAAGPGGVVEYMAQSRHIGLQRRVGRGRRMVTPHRLHEFVDRNDGVGMDDEHRKQSAEPRTASSDDRAVIVYLDRTQHPILHKSPPR